MAKNGLDIGNFGFFRDAELTLRIDEDNLYDQIDADGYVYVWLGGNNIYLPEYGEFNVHVTSEMGFFWDIIDGNGDRTKDGFEEIFIPYNPSMEPFVGDLIPLNPEEVFNQGTTPEFKCSNIWFFNNLFRDNYYRYNLIVLNSTVSSGWPDEANAKILPMNEGSNIILDPGDFIVGYRPKPEYMNQLAVVKRISSGRDNSIMFRLKIDLDFLAENPTSIRKIRIFTQSDDKSEFMVYPENVDRIYWDTHNVPFMSEYNRYLLYNGIQQYSPSVTEMTAAHAMYDKFMEASNYAVKADSSNRKHIVSDADKIFGGEYVKLVGFSAMVLPYFLDWVKENVSTSVPKDTPSILRRVILTSKYFKGFSILDDILGDIIGEYAEASPLPAIWDGDTEVADGNITIVNGGSNTNGEAISEIVGISIIDGVRIFENGHAPDSAHGYLTPESGSDYTYQGDIGNGLYKIAIGGYLVDVFCDMANGGWMYLIVGGDNWNYTSQFADISSTVSTMYYSETYGTGWGKNDGNMVSLGFYNMPFSEVKLEISGDYDNPEDGTGYFEMHTGANGAICSFIDDDESGEMGQSVIVDGVAVVANDKTDLTRFPIEFIGTNNGQNNLTLKMGGDSNAPYCRRYVRMLAIK